jgi:hypothetical protein
MTDDARSAADARIAAVAGVAAFFQYGTLGWIRDRGLDLDDYNRYLASFSWQTSRPGVGARRIAEVVASQIAASGAVEATVTGHDKEAMIDLVGPNDETLRWAGASREDAYRQIEGVFGPIALRLGHTLRLEAHGATARVLIRPTDPAT